MTPAYAIGATSPAMLNGYVKPGGYLNRITALRYVKAYRDLHHAYLQSHPLIGFDTIYADFDLEKLIKFLTYLKATSDGCRIYLGANDATAITAEGFDYSNKTTFVLVGTKTLDNGCIEEIIADADIDKLGFDFGSLCPPECSHCSCTEPSLARDIYGSILCP